MIIDPSPFAGGGAACCAPTLISIGTPTIRRSPPKLVCTRTPTVQPPNCAGSLRLDVPIPPFHPNATVPRPAPTAPSATGPLAASRMALRTSASVIGRARMLFRKPSFVSPTTGFADRTSSLPGSASNQVSTASAARGTHSVQVNTIGDSSSPSSFTCVAPISLPKPLPTTIAAGTRSRKTFPSCGRIAVTPVLIESPCAMVTWPTRTPATSVIASSGPDGSTPTTMPKSRARGRGAWARSGAVVRLRSRRMRSAECGIRNSKASPSQETPRRDGPASDRFRIPHSVFGIRVAPLRSQPASSPPDVLAGTPQDLAALLARAALKLDPIRSIVLAWPELLLAGEQSATLDTLLAELRDVPRIVLSWNPSALGDFLERHARRAEVVGALPVDADGRPLPPIGPARYVVIPPFRRPLATRSEEHTSELQSRLHLVCRLLL